MPNSVTVTLSGVQVVIDNLRASQRRVGQGVENGLKIAGLQLQHDSQKLTPVEFGNLKGSAFTRAKGIGLNTEVYIGYTAAYALYVHELVGMLLKGRPRVPNPPHKGLYWDPQGQAQAKFLETPFRKLSQSLNKTVGDQIRAVL